MTVVAMVDSGNGDVDQSEMPVEYDLSAVNQAAVEMEQRQRLLKERRLALAKDPRNLQLLNEVGEISEAAGDMDRAIWAYRRSVRLDPTYPDAYRNLGRLYEKRGKTKQALEALQNYLSYGGEEVDVEPLKNSLLNMAGDKNGQRTEPSSGASTEPYVKSPVLDKLTRKLEELDLTPGEAIYLLDPDNENGREMMRYTLLDMISRGILQVDEKYGVRRGAQYGSTELQPHERLFARLFSRYEDTIDIKRLTQTVTHQLNNRFDSYQTNYVRRSLEEKGYIRRETKRVGRVIPVQHYVLTDKGLRVSSQLKRLMKQAEVQMDRVLKTNPQQAQAFVADGGPAILLMKSHPSGYFQEWTETLNRMGLGPVVDRTMTRLENSNLRGIVEEILKAIFSE